ncbi:hypothetical protein HPB49_004205 [Dermacentor silvarum]|uniref:Uncharacterized protein n=1 Tax=Dermacentor silvarum TaxID=543639 RepID=A0ACB8CVC8_DERSI|nr:hypothetical protein HPB49_004205 [Dermacentor silvarum]
MWPPFWEQFNQVIHNNGGLTDVDKFTYPRSVLTSDATLAIAGLPATASCYSDALLILKRRFAKDDLIIRDHMPRLIDLQPVRSPSDLCGLRSLYDTVQSQTRALKTLGVSEDNYSSMLYPILPKSLPRDIVLDFNKTIARQSLKERGGGEGGVGSTGEQAQPTQQQKASIGSLLLFIQTDIESRERTVLHICVQWDALKSKDK